MKFESENNESSKIEKPQESSLILKNKILKLEKNYINLKNLAVSVNLEIIMSGESSLFIFSRVNDYLNTESTVCQISKEMDSARKFLNFGVLMKRKENDNFCLRNIRKQEIPKHGNFFLQNFFWLSVCT